MLREGQRVLASFNGETPHLGVVSDASREGRYSVQFQPCGCHYVCSSHRVSGYGDRNGWTDQEYRVERERSYCDERARDVENERRQRYPTAPFSAYPNTTEHAYE